MRQKEKWTNAWTIKASDKTARWCSRCKWEWHRGDLGSRLTGSAEAQMDIGENRVRASPGKVNPPWNHRGYPERSYFLFIYFHSTRCPATAGHLSRDADTSFMMIHGGNRVPRIYPPLKHDVLGSVSLFFSESLAFRKGCRWFWTWFVQVSDRIYISFDRGGDKNCPFMKLFIKAGKLLFFLFFYFISVFSRV